jgi:hypothetical protein
MRSILVPACTGTSIKISKHLLSDSTEFLRILYVLSSGLCLRSAPIANNNSTSEHTSDSTSWHSGRLYSSPPMCVVSQLDFAISRAYQETLDKSDPVSRPKVPSRSSLTWAQLMDTHRRTSAFTNWFSTSASLSLLARRPLLVDPSSVPHSHRNTLCTTKPAGI